MKIPEETARSRPSRRPARPLVIAPDPRLRRRSEPVAAVDDGVRRLMDELLEAMRAANGIGLAAPQLGVFRRVIVVDSAPGREAAAPLRMADPRILRASAETATVEEGCLSLPEQYAEVERSTRVRVAWRDETGAGRETDAEGLFAACLQHEIDHLDGVLFIDRISRVRRSMILRRLAKLRKAEAGKERAA